MIQINFKEIFEYFDSIFLSYSQYKQRYMKKWKKWMIKEYFIEILVISVLNSKMIIIPFLFCILSNEKEINITDALIGDWRISHLTIDQNSFYSELPDRYKLFIEATGDDFIGNLSLFDESNQAPPYKIKFTKNGDLDYSILYSINGSEFEEFIPHLAMKTGVDNLIQAFGHINSTVRYSLHYFSSSQIEITLYNTESNEIFFYHLSKILPPKNPPITTLQIFLPMLPIFIMMYNRGKAQQEQQKKKIRITRSNKKE